MAALPRVPEVMELNLLIFPTCRRPQEGRWSAQSWAVTLVPSGVLGTRHTCLKISAPLLQNVTWKMPGPSKFLSLLDKRAAVTAHIIFIYFFLKLTFNWLVPGVQHSAPTFIRYEVAVILLFSLSCTLHHDLCIRKPWGCGVQHREKSQ